MVLLEDKMNRQQEISVEMWRNQSKERKLRQEWIEKFKETDDYKNLQQERLNLREECAKLSHVNGGTETNYLGTDWDRCKFCGARFNIQTID